MAVAIEKGTPLVALITVHTCKAEDQHELVDLLRDAVDTIYRHAPGFVSASIHRSLDGVRVTNYAQYRSRDDFERLRTNPAVSEFARKVGALASFDPHLYEVVEVIET